MGQRLREAGRLARGALRRVARRTQMTIMWAPVGVAEAPCADGYVLVRITPDASAADLDLAEAAMRMAEEPPGLVAARLAHGDELFGWQSEGRIVTFGWITYRHRSIGPVRLADGPGRVFLYNFFTAEAYRGRGLSPALHDAIRWALAREGVTDLFTDVNVRNAASIRAIEKSGFVPVARIAFLTLLNRWRLPLKPTVSSDSGRQLLGRH